MLRYSVQPRDQIFVKAYGFFLLLKAYLLLKTWVKTLAKYQ